MTDNDGLAIEPPLGRAYRRRARGWSTLVKTPSESVIRHVAGVEATFVGALLFVAQLFEDVSDSKGVMGSDAANALESEDLVGDLGDGPLRSADEASFDHGVPGIIFLAT